MAEVHVLDHPLIQHKLAILRSKDTPMEARHLLDALISSSNAELTGSGKRIMTIVTTSQVEKLF